MRLRFLYIIMILTFASSSCEEKKDPKVQMEERIQVRLNNVKAERFIRCKKEALELAETKVDSMLRALAKKMTSDTSVVISKPEKPEKPEFMIPADTISLTPPLKPTKREY